MDLVLRAERHIVPFDEAKPMASAFPSRPGKAGPSGSAQPPKAKKPEVHPDWLKLVTVSGQDMSKTNGKVLNNNLTLRM